MNPFRSMFFMARRFKTETAMNFFGLVVTFSAFYLMASQVEFSRNYNRRVPDSERIFRLETSEGVLNDHSTNAVIASMPQVEAVSEVGDWIETATFSNGQTQVGHAIQPSGLTPFGAIATQCLDGQLQWDSLGQPGVLIPASLARKLFGGEVSVAGRSLLWNSDTVTVRGVYQDLPDNCSMGNHVYFTNRPLFESKEQLSSILYLKLRPEVYADVFVRDFGNQLERLVWESEWNGALATGAVTPEMEPEMRQQFKKLFASRAFHLRPVHDTWFSGVYKGDKGNPTMFFILQLACVLLIVIAFVNFHNFVLAESPARVRGINTRRILGESLWKIRFDLLSETVLTSVLAMMASLVAIVAVSHHSTDLLQGDVSLSNHPLLVVLMAVLSVVVGLLAGAYPAVFATSFPLAVALKGSFGLTPKGLRLRSWLVGAQLAVALFMFIYIGILLLQGRYVYRSDFGFLKDDVLCAQLPGPSGVAKETLRSQLLRVEGVSDVSYSRFVLGTQDFYVDWGQFNDAHRVNVFFSCLYVDCHYLRTMGIEIVDGRDFNERDGDCFIVNEALQKEYPWLQVGHSLMDNMPIVGVCRNPRFASVRKDRSREPLAFVVLGQQYADWDDMLHVVNVRIDRSADPLLVRQQVEHLLQSAVGGEEVQAMFIDQKLEQLYQDEFRFIRQIGWLAFLTLLITLIGVFSLVLCETEYRRREIGIRKVMGASVSSILLLLCRRYVWLLVVSFFVSAPLAWLVGRQWLQSFAEHTSIPWWLFPLSLLSVGLVTLATVVVPSWKAANARPTDSILNQ